MGIKISAIEYYLPVNERTNADLERLRPEWDIEKVTTKTGVEKRHIASNGETALDLAIEATEQLFRTNSIQKDEIDGILFCTQSPDFIMPSNAFLIHERFGFSEDTWAFDFNLACSGYVYGMSIARGFIESGMSKNIMLITSDTYSKHISQKDRSTVSLFGDGAAVTIISEDSSNQSEIISTKLSSSGKDYKSFFIPSGGCRLPKSEFTDSESEDRSGNIRSLENIHMNGFAVWKFISKKVPKQIKEILLENELGIEDIDFWAFHQASKLTLQSLSSALNLPEEKLYSNLVNIGNTVSSSIPILLKDAFDERRLKRGDLVIISGFGVGLSWGTMLLKY